MANAIPVYSAEIKDGLGQAIAQKNVLAYAMPVLLSPDNLKKQLLTTAVLQSAKASFGDDVTFDLYPIHTIMVTTGWNDNDDIFTRAETWAARFTPEDKPFNIGHEPRQIIGHITANTVVDDDLTVIEPESPFDDIPDKFHILTSAVVYRHLNSRDDTLEAEAAELIESIQAGDWFVSMECLFANFDYGITYTSGEQQIVTRNSETAFLTKHLRIHGGYGGHNGGKLGRVLRHITFSGKGLVEKPANPESVIFNDTTQFSGVAFTLEQSETAVAHNSKKPGEEQMADNEKLVTKLEQEVAALNERLAEANSKIETLGDANVKAAIAEKDSEITGLKAELEGSQAKLDEMTTKYNEAVAARDEFEKGKTDAETQLAEAKGKLDAAAATAQTAERVALLVDKKVEKATAEEIVAKYANLDDEQFASIAETHGELAVAKCKGDDEEKNKGGKSKADDESASASDDDDGGEGDDAGAAAADDTNLNDAQPEGDAALASDDSDSKDEELMTSLAGFLDTAMHGDPAGE